MKRFFTYLLSLCAIVSCLQEERSPEEILVPTPAQVECSDESLMLTSKVPSGSEKLVQECGFYYSKDKSMADTRKVAGVLAANNFTAELPDRTYGTTYYICSYVTNGHGSEIRSDLRSYTLDELDDYVEFGALDMLSYDKNSSTLDITIDAEIWGGVKITEIGVCYGDSPTGLDIDGPHKVGVWNRTQTKGDAGVVTISIDGLSDATQYYLRPYVKDGEYLSYGEVVPFYIPAVAKVSTFDAEAVTASGATLSGEVTDECGSAVTERGFVWVEGDVMPTIEDSFVPAGSGLGTMTATVEGLQPNKKYTFRAYATNASGTAYGEAKVFTTLVALPSLAASTVSNITSTSATFNGVLANNGGESVSEVGFYYSTEKEVNPETAQKVSLEYSTYQKSAKELSANTLYSAMQSAQAAASDEGESFSIDVYSLGIKTKYYVKSYAVNSAGVAYGSVVNFETAGEIATIKTVGSSEVTTSSAVLSANITTDNGEKITERGFVWMEGAGNPTIDSNKLKVSGEVGEYTATLEGLDPNKKYSFRAYAINAEGTAYGDVMSFTTKVALPALSNVVIPSLSSTTATLTSKVTYHGGETVTEVGFYYSTESDVDPETSQKVSRLYSEDTFSIEVANLGINTKYYVKAYAINSAGTAYSEINSFKTESSVPSVQTIGVADITPESALLSGSILSDNGASITERGFVWIQGDGTPTVDSHKLTATGTTGEFTSSLTGLEPNKKYSFRAYATNSKGTAYGEIMTFLTVAGLPVLSSVDVSAITSTSATFSSIVTDHGGETVSEVGFYYSTDETVDPATSVKVTQKYAKDAFTSQIADLAIFTKYYVKAYATNSAGTAYSDVVEFKTLASTPVVNTVGSSDITFNSATLSGKVLTDNGAAITERGFVWTKGSETPTTSSNKLKVTGTLGEYTGTLSGLDPNQSYSFRAYAINELGTSYGAVMTFETVIGLPALGSVAISNITSTSASLQGTITSHGGEDVAEAGFYYSTDESLDPSNSIQIEIKSPGTTFSKSIEGLTPNTKYYVKSYAKNSIGTTYSAVTNFTTLASTPVVNTVGSSSITATSAVLSGTVVTDNGGTIQERGFVWLQGSGVPTIDSNKIKATGTTGDYTITLEGLEPNQTYSYRAYAYNSLGVAYGQTKTFTTSLAAPSLGTTSVSNVASRSATFNGVVASDGGKTISEVGFYYSTSETVDPSSSQKVNIKYSDYQTSAKGYASSMMYSSNTASTETTLDSGDIFSIDVFDLALKTHYYVKSYAVNSVGTSYGDVVNFMTQGEIPVVNTVAYSDVGTHSVTLSGKVVSDSGEKITERGFVWMEGDGNPTTSSNRLKVDGETGDYTASLTELSPNKKYTFRAYAINAEGTAYGELKSFTTKVALPTVSNAVIYSVTATSASFSAKVTNHGGETVSEVGFYYSTNAEVNPESAQKVNMPYSADSFSIDVAELLVNTKYYVRSYTKNSAGTSYGTIENFTTLASVPVVKTIGSSDMTESGALLSGTVVTDNGATITERGFVWLKGTDAPTPSSNKVKVEGATGDFTATISGLDPNQKYSFRAYAINSKGTAYGDIMTFNTIAGLPALSAMKVSSITTTSATFTCTVTNHGGETVSEVGFYYSKEENVDVETAQKISEGYSSDAFSLEAEGLEIGQNYYVKAYTKNSIGEVYSAVVPFKTTSSAPSVSTIGYTKLSATSAELSGEVTDDNGENIFERGFVWIKGTSTPTTSHNKLPAFAGVGEYAVLFEGIEPNQVYSYRAYAINSIGTAYGDVMQLQINVSLPVVTTNDVTGITNTSATSGGVIYSDGGGEILSKGVVWSMRENPTVESSNMTNDGEGNSAFASHITDLCQGLTYYVRAYATNIMGTVYGEEKQFTTTGEIQGTPLEASNSFIISAPGTYTFQTVKGNSTESVGSVASAEVLWESFGTDEKPGIGSVVSFAAYNNGKIGFAPSDRFREGNAVIAAKDASGTILWSWHIWLTDQPQEHIYPNNAGTMMDRNLGATSATPGDAGALGLLYQWGRKDPFLGGSSIDCFDVVAKSTIAWPEKENCTTATGTVAYAIEHPTTFITDSQQDWCYTEGYGHHDYTRWKSDKTIYDPCPVGWRVPDGGESGVWNISGVYDDYTYDSSDKSMIFYISSPDVTCYPASGYRDYYGKLFGVGSVGYYWSVKPSIEEYDLSFQNANLFPPTDGLSLAEARSVRCQKEGTGGGLK